MQPRPINGKARVVPSAFEGEAIALNVDDRRCLAAFEDACMRGILPTVQSLLASAETSRPPTFLHHGLAQALRGGHVQLVQHLLSIGAPIGRQTAFRILNAPPEKQLALFALLAEYGWAPGTPGFYGDMLLPYVVSNHTLLRWFLSHSVNPNHGRQSYNRDSFGGPDTESGAALEAAAVRNDVDALCILLDSGADVRFGAPLHRAAGICPPGVNPYYERPQPSQEVDRGAIPTMALLVQRGADVNKREESRHVVPGYSIIHAVMAGAKERVRWLLEHGANPHLQGGWGSAVAIACKVGGEMAQIVDDGIKARKWEIC